MRSLLGRDEAFVVEKLQLLIRNEESVEAQKEEIASLKIDLEKLKEDKYHLTNKLECKIDIIEDMENELEKYETASKNDEKKIESKENKLDELEKFIAVQVEEMNILLDNNHSMVSQIAENLRMEKQINVQNVVIKDLQDRLNDVKKDDLTREVDRLIVEVETIQKENEEKVKRLKDLEKENQILEDNLKFEQEEKQSLQECLEKVDDNLSLNEELSMEKRKFSCEVCGKGFGIQNDLHIHLEMIHKKEIGLKRVNEKFVSLETKVLQQKFILMSSLSSLQEKDLKRKHVCHCTGVCRINHNIYNWSRPRSETLVIKSKEVLEKQILVDKEPEANNFQCKNCGQTFKSPEHLNTHVEALQCIKPCLVNPWGLNFLQ